MLRSTKQKCQLNNIFGIPQTLNLHNAREFGAASASERPYNPK